MKTFLLFFRNFLICTFQNRFAWILHFVVPLVSFVGMFLLLRVAESAAFAATQAIGLVVFFSMIQAALIVSLVLKDREQGIMKRILVSPAAQIVYVLGNGAAAFLVMTIQVILFVSFITFIFPVNLGLDTLWLLVILMVYNLTCIGFGFLITAFSDSSTTALMIANVLVMITSLMGGSFFPVEFMSGYMQKLAIAFPQYWVMKAIRQSQTGASPADTGLSLLILFLFAVLFVVVQNAIAGRRSSAS